MAGNAGQHATDIADEKAVAVPTAAVQVGQTGNYVFVVKDGIAGVRPVKVARAVERNR